MLPNKDSIPLFAFHAIRLEGIRRAGRKKEDGIDADSKCK